MILPQNAYLGHIYIVNAVHLKSMREQFRTDQVPSKMQTYDINSRKYKVNWTIKVYTVFVVVMLILPD